LRFGKKNSGNLGLAKKSTTKITNAICIDVVKKNGRGNAFPIERSVSLDVKEEVQTMSHLFKNEKAVKKQD